MRASCFAIIRVALIAAAEVQAPGEHERCSHIITGRSDMRSPGGSMLRTSLKVSRRLKTPPSCMIQPYHHQHLNRARLECIHCSSAHVLQVLCD